MGHSNLNVLLTYLRGLEVPELVPKIAFYPKSFSLRITLVIRVDEIEKRAKNVPKSG